MKNEKRIIFCFAGAFLATFLTLQFSWPLFLARAFIGLAALVSLLEGVEYESKKRNTIRILIVIVCTGISFGTVFAAIDLIEQISKAIS